MIARVQSVLRHVRSTLVWCAVGLSTACADSAIPVAPIAPRPSSTARDVEMGVEFIAIAQTYFQSGMSGQPIYVASETGTDSPAGFWATQTYFQAVAEGGSAGIIEYIPCNTPDNTGYGVYCAGSLEIRGPDCTADNWEFYATTSHVASFPTHTEYRATSAHRTCGPNTVVTRICTTEWIVIEISRNGGPWVPWWSGSATVCTLTAGGPWYRAAPSDTTSGGQVPAPATARRMGPAAKFIAAATPAYYGSNIVIVRRKDATPADVVVLPTNALDGASAARAIDDLRIVRQLTGDVPTQSAMYRVQRNNGQADAHAGSLLVRSTPRTTGLGKYLAVLLAEAPRNALLDLDSPQGVDVRPSLDRMLIKPVTRRPRQ